MSRVPCPAVFSLFLSGCIGTTSPSTSIDSLVDGGVALKSNNVGSVSLVDHHKWKMLDTSQDSHWSADAGFVPCTDADFGVEGSVVPYLEVSTDACNYITVYQSAISDVRSGDTIIIALSHEALVGVGALAHAAVQAGDKILWSQDIPLAANAQSHNTSMVVNEGFPLGTTILFHIDNHGANSWRLLDIARTR